MSAFLFLVFINKVKCRWENNNHTLTILKSQAKEEVCEPDILRELKKTLV